MRALKEIKDRLLEEWDAYFNIERPENLYPLIVKKDSRYCLFFFTKQYRLPIAFGKVSAQPYDYSLLQNEYRMLRFIQEAPIDYCSDAAPVPFFEMEIDNIYSVVTSYISGQSLVSRIMSSYNPFKIRIERDIVSQVFSLWKSIHADHRLRCPLTKEFLIDYFEKTQRSFNTAFAADNRINAELCRIRNCIDTVGSINTWIAPVHGDYWKGNLIRKGWKIYATDWERSKMAGLPIFDIFMFCSTYYFKYDDVYSFKEMYLKQSRVNMIIREIIHKARVYLNINEDLMKIMFEMFLLEMCTIGITNFNRKISYDDKWRQRLDILFKNRELIFSSLRLNQCMSGNSNFLQ
ncbi:MAG: hypothetical protein H6Q52_157 [Deltaproteobacteria bacterium]|nr:hypothetical protein [Deltaproteobacteria bacterium]